MPLNDLDNCIFWSCYSRSWAASHGEVTEIHTLLEIKRMAEAIGKREFSEEEIVKSLSTPRVSPLKGPLFHLEFTSDGALIGARLNQQALSSPKEWGFR